MPDVDAVEPEPKPKAAPPQKKPEVNQTPEEEEPWEGDPKVYLDMILGWAEQSFKTHKTSDSVREIWRANKQGIDKLEKEYPEIFKQMREEFAQLAEKATEEEAKDGE